MALRRIEEIKIAPSGHLLVRPESAEGAMDALIYRAGNGVRWDPNERAFHAGEPHRWEHAELLQHIVRTLADECGDTFRFRTSRYGPMSRKSTLRFYGRRQPMERLMFNHLLQRTASPPAELRR